MMESKCIYCHDSPMPYHTIESLLLWIFCRLWGKSHSCHPSKMCVCSLFSYFFSLSVPLFGSLFCQVEKESLKSAKTLSLQIEIDINLVNALRSPGQDQRCDGFYQNSLPKDLVNQIEWLLSEFPSSMCQIWFFIRLPIKCSQSTIFKCHFTVSNFINGNIFDISANPSI